MAKMIKSIPKTLLKLYEEYKATDYVTDIDFIQKCITKHKLSTEDVIVDYFLRLTQCEEFFTKIANKFISSEKLRKVNVNFIKVLMFFCIFVLNCENINDLVEDPVFYTIPLLRFLSLEENYPFMAKCCAQHFENNFIVQNILGPLLNKADAFKTIEKYIKTEEQKRIPHKHATVSKEFKFEKPTFGAPLPPMNTPDLVDTKTESICHENRSYLQIKKALNFEHEKNVKRAQKLLQESQAFNTARLVTVKDVKISEPQRVQPKKSKKVPPVKPVEIKGNTTTTLREAYLLIKEHEEEINKIENIIKGGYTMQKVMEIEQEERRKADQKAVEDIKRKHLLGLITFEESILAKKKLIESNKERMAQVMVEKMELAEKLEEWRKEEQEKIKAKVEKSQQIKMDMKESEKRQLEKKQEEVRIQQHEIKQMLKKNEEEKAAELAKKIELIQEIKTIHEINSKMNETRREFDPTETANLGLLCEMSIAELHERLLVEKMRMTNELKEKRNKIVNRKAEQQKMIENYKEIITKMRQMQKCNIDSVPIIQKPEEENKELTKLRKILEEKRNERTKVSA